jgi:hypothetical protein
MTNGERGSFFDINERKLSIIVLALIKTKKAAKFLMLCSITLCAMASGPILVFF